MEGIIIEVEFGKKGNVNIPPGNIHPKQAYCKPRSQEEHRTTILEREEIAGEKCSA